MTNIAGMSWRCQLRICSGVKLAISLPCESRKSSRWPRCITELRRSALAGCEGKTALAAAEVMDDCDRPMKLVDVAVADWVATYDGASRKNADAWPHDAFHRSNENKLSRRERKRALLRNLMLKSFES